MYPKSYYWYIHIYVFFTLLFISYVLSCVYISVTFPLLWQKGENIEYLTTLLNKENKWRTLNRLNKEKGEDRILNI